MSQASELSDRSAFVARWKTVSGKLAEISLAEMRSLTLDQRQKQIECLLDLGVRYRRERTDLGLIRLQQLLRRLHEARSDRLE